MKYFHIFIGVFFYSIILIAGKIVEGLILPVAEIGIKDSYVFCLIS